MEDYTILIINYLINYDNKNNLSWMQVYKDTLTKLQIKNEINNYQLLNNVIRGLTLLGYDIIPDPFKLKKWK